MTFSSGKYIVIRDEHKGFVSKEWTLRVDPIIGKKDDMDTCIHEGLHAEFPHMSEERVAKAAGRLTKFLWKLGYRWKKPKKKIKKK